MSAKVDKDSAYSHMKEIVPIQLNETVIPHVSINLSALSVLLILFKQIWVCIYKII